MTQFVTWWRGMSRMSGILILSYRLKEVINSYVLHCFWSYRIVHISGTTCLIEMGFGSKCSILNGQVIYIEKSKSKIADIWLIPLDCVTFCLLQFPTPYCVKLNNGYHYLHFHQYLRNRIYLSRKISHRLLENNELILIPKVWKKKTENQTRLL